MSEGLRIRPTEEGDVEGAALVHGRAFPRQRHSREWIECALRARPRTHCFVADEAGVVVGYIHWMEKSGFRDEVVLELEQVAVSPDRQGRGVATALIRDSLPEVRDRLRDRGATLKHVIVTTRADNAAQRLYRTVLGAEVEARIENLYSADEVLMVARDVAVPERGHGRMSS